MNNCLLTGNSASYGGGAGSGLLNNCTLAGNQGDYGGGASWATLKNCIAYGNYAGNENVSNHYECAFTNSCTTPDPGGTGNITDDPQFVDAGAGNYRLQATSPCIDRGSNAYSQGTTDLDGNPRIANGTVDMGTYEFCLATCYETWAAGITNGLTNATDCAAGDGVPNLLKYAMGCPNPMEPDDLARLVVMGGGAPALTFNRNLNASDLMLVIQGADSISNGAAWRGLATNVGGSWLGATNVEESGAGNPVECTVTDPVALQSNRFLRLRVSRP